MTRILIIDITVVHLHAPRMKPTTPRLRWYPKRAPHYLLPEPYRLFPATLYENVPEVAPAPVPTGLTLFDKVAGYKSFAVSKRIWATLEHSMQRVFDEPPEPFAWHYRRIAQGYEAAATSTDDFNPYYELTLYPWEIVKDKLRHRPMFPADVYDMLIDEAFGLRKGRLKPEALWRNDMLLEGKEPGQFRLEPPEVRETYTERARRKLNFHERMVHEMNARPQAYSPYQHFFVQHQQEHSTLPTPERSKILGERWRAMSSDEKKAYGELSTLLRTRRYREQKLQAKTDLVMDYIFQTGTVEGFTYDWRHWRARTCGDWFYLDKLWFPYLYQRTKGTAELIKCRLEQAS